MIPEAAERAAKLVKDLGQEGRIVVICGDMQSIEIPDAIDVCTQGIIAVSYTHLTLPTIYSV